MFELELKNRYIDLEVGTEFDEQSNVMHERNSDEADFNLKRSNEKKKKKDLYGDDDTFKELKIKYRLMMPRENNNEML